MESSGGLASSASGPPELSSTAGRKDAFLIGVAGGTASGKTTVCDMIMQRLHDQCVVILSQDSFYRNLTGDELELVKHNNYNFDHPDAFDRDLLLQQLQDLRRGNSIDVPVYDFATHRRSDTETRKVEAADVIIIEGILVLHMKEICNLMHMKVFVDTDDDVRLARRIKRDVQSRGRNVGGVIDQYTKFVKPSFDQFVAPSRRIADIIIPWQRGNNVVAIDLITEHIRTKLQKHELLRIYHNLEVIPSNYQIRGMHTIIRDHTTDKNDFVFYVDRLNRLVVEAGLGLLPFNEKVVITNTKHKYVGVEFAKKLCGVSIIRSGESMENALRACCKGIKIGKILVHRVRPVLSTHSSLSPRNVPPRSVSYLPDAEDEPPLPSAAAAVAAASMAATAAERGLLSSGQVDGTWEQEIIYEKLPHDIAERHVLLMDPILGTGNSACRAIEVLLDKGVKSDRIFFLTLIAAPQGIRKVCGEHPQVRVITSEVDQGINSNWQVVPGVGEFGDRYFCD